MKIVDMHCDTIGEIFYRKNQGETICLEDNGLHIDLKRMREGDYLLQNFALFVHLKRVEDPFAYCMRMLDCFYEQIEQYPDAIGVVRTYQDIEENQKKGKMSALLTIEEGGVCRGDLALLRDFYRLGVRMMTMTWNFENELAYPNRMDLKTGKAIPETENGLKEKGIAFIEEMERLGMIVDVSHMGDAGIYDVLRHAKKPFVASHSNARAVCSHPRNLTDDMIRAIAERGGVIGMNFCASFLDEKEDEKQCFGSVERLIAHMRHMKQVGGIDCIGLGTDFDGIGSNIEILGAGKMPVLVREMEKAGFSTEEIEKICYKNVLRLYKELL